MIDPRALVDAALTADTPAALGLTLLAGLITSVGPCVAPRYIAISAIAANYRRPIIPTLTFIAGILCTFTIVGFGSSVLGSLWALSTPLYILLAVGLICGGCMTLVRAGTHRCSHQAATTSACAQAIAPSKGRRSAGAVFLLGAASALIVSPCCTPFIAGIAAAAAATGKPIVGMLLLLSFALGHALPLLLAGNAGSLMRGPLRWRVPEQAAQIVAGTLMLALGAFYGLLA